MVWDKQDPNPRPLAHTNPHHTHFNRWGGDTSINLFTNINIYNKTIPETVKLHQFIIFLRFLISWKIERVMIV